MGKYLDGRPSKSVIFDIGYLEALGDNPFEYCLYQLIINNG